MKLISSSSLKAHYHPVSVVAIHFCFTITHNELKTKGPAPEENPQMKCLFFSFQGSNHHGSEPYFLLYM